MKRLNDSGSICRLSSAYPKVCVLYTCLCSSRKGPTAVAKHSTTDYTNCRYERRVKILDAHFRNNCLSCVIGFKFGGSEQYSIDLGNEISYACGAPLAICEKYQKTKGGFIQKVTLRVISKLVGAEEIQAAESLVFESRSQCFTAYDPTVEVSKDFREMYELLPYASGCLTLCFEVWAIRQAIL